MKFDWYKLGLVVLACGLFAIACNHKEKMSKAEDKAEVIEQIVEGLTKGTVTTDYSERGCDIIIITNGEEGQQLLLPLNLDEKYQVNGKKIYFKYTPSRAPQPAGCNIGMLVSLSDVTE